MFPSAALGRSNARPITGLGEIASLPGSRCNHHLGEEDEAIHLSSGEHTAAKHPSYPENLEVPRYPGISNTRHGRMGRISGIPGIPGIARIARI